MENNAMNYKVMSRAGSNAWIVRYFETEAAARTYATQCSEEAYADTIEIYRKTRSGYRMVDSIREHWRKAAERWADDCAESAPYFC